jgi:hypothetical protein
MLSHFEFSWIAAITSACRTLMCPYQLNSNVSSDGLTMSILLCLCCVYAVFNYICVYPVENYVYSVMYSLEAVFESACIE